MLHAFRLHFSKLPAETKEKLKKINQRILLGSLATERSNSIAACKFWLEGWALIKSLATPETRNPELFEQAYHGLLVKQFFEFFYGLPRELHNAGLSDHTFHETCLRYLHEFWEVFPLELEDEDSILYFRRAEGESLWELGQIAESEAVYATLVERLPDEGWAYIGWADQYWLWHNSPKKYAQGETILKKALERSDLKDKDSVLERLMNLYNAWGKEAKADEIEKLLTPLLEDRH